MSLLNPVLSKDKMLLALNGRNYVFSTRRGFERIRSSANCQRCSRHLECYSFDYPAFFCTGDRRPDGLYGFWAEAT